MCFSQKEKNLLFFPSATLTNNGNIEELFCAGKFLDVIVLFINNTFLQDSSFCINAKNSAGFVQYLNLSINEFLSNLCEQNNFTEYNILLVGITCLFYFIQQNWTGPLKSLATNDCILKHLIKNSEDIENKTCEIEEHINVFLSQNDDNIISCNTKQSVLLFLSQLIFRWIPRLQSKHWWLMRSLYIHQLLLADPSPAIYKQLMNIIEEIQNSVKSAHDPALQLLFNLERVQIHLHLYSEISVAQPLVQEVFDSLELEATLVGKLGKRTRFQERDIAQLTLKVDSNNLTNLTDIDSECSRFPKDQRLDDEVRLSEIKFTDEFENPSSNGIQQASILAMFVLMKKSKPKDKLQLEELSPYLYYLLSRPKVWCIQLSALLFRSQLETESSRTVERSITQIQSLISDLESPNPPAVERLPFVFSSFIASKWKLEMNLAKLLVEVGAIQSALDIYNHLQMWEEIVACYNYLKLRHKAAEVIRGEMVKQETVQLWCLLGDATDDETCYQKAWDLSDYKSSRAQKHWGLYYFQKKQYEESIPHLQKSLDLNPLQVPLWFNLGYAALVQEKWQLSATAFRRYCSLEPDSFEAWNNLAKAYIKLGQKDRAWRALQEAVKCNYDNWKVWDNLMAVSTDLADFHEVIRCYHRILDIKGKHVDIEVLRIMVNAIKNNCVEGDLLALKKHATILFGRLTSQVLSNADLWKLYATLISATEENEADKHQKIVLYLQKAQRISTQEPNWENTISGCKKIIDLCLDLSRVQKICSDLVPKSQTTEHLNSAKLMLRAVSSKIKKVHTDALGILNEDLAESVHKLDSEFDEVEILLNQLTDRSK